MCGSFVQRSIWAWAILLESQDILTIVECNLICNRLPMDGAFNRHIKVQLFESKVNF